MLMDPDTQGKLVSIHCTSAWNVRLSPIGYLTGYTHSFQKARPSWYAYKQNMDKHFPW